MTLSDEIVGLCSGEEGATRAEIIALTGRKFTVLDAKLPVLVRRGKLVQVAIYGQLARYFAHAAHAKAWRQGQPALPTAQQQIRAIFKARPNAGHTGASIKPLIQFCGKEVVHRALREMRESGELVAVQIGHQAFMHFASQEAARAFQEQRAKPKPKRVRQPGTAKTAARARASVAKGKVRDEREVIIPPHVLVQVCPCAEVFSRHQITSKDKVPRVFCKIPYGATLTAQVQA